MGGISKARYVRWSPLELALLFIWWLIYFDSARCILGLDNVVCIIHTLSGVDDFVAIRCLLWCA